MSTTYETKKVSQLDEAASASGADFVPVVQSGVTKRVSMENIVVGRSTEADHATAADDADTVGGKALATPISPNTGLAGAWGPGLPRYPDNPSGMIYFQDAWATTDSWVSNASLGNATVAVSGGTLITTATQNAVLFGAQRAITAISGSTIRLRIRSSKSQTIRLGGTVDGATFTTIKDFTVSANTDTVLDCTVNGALTLLYFHAFSASALIGDTVTVDWIYVGDGTYTTKLPDLSGNGNHGTVYGATPGADGSLSFDKTNDYVRNTTIPPPPTNYSMSVWFKPTVNVTDTQRIFSIVTDKGLTGFFIAGSQLRADSRNSASGQVSVAITPVISPNVEYHAVLVRSGSTISLYLNGVLGGSNTGADAVFASVSYADIGAAGSATYFGGTIRSPRIYNRALSAEEIWDLYAQDGKQELNRQVQAVTPVPNSLVVRDATGVTEFSGIRFPATQVADAGANVLDDYEEGTFTPAITFGGGNTGITYNASSTSGTYTKVGKKVFYNLVVVLTSKGSSTGVIRITGLPFASPNIVTGASPGSPMLNVVTFSGIVIYSVLQNTSQISIAQCTTAGVYSELTDTSFANNSVIRVAGHYDT